MDDGGFIPLDVDAAFKALEQSLHSALRLRTAVLKSVTKSTEAQILSEFAIDCLPGKRGQRRFRPVDFQKYAAELKIANRDTLAVYQIFKHHGDDCEKGNAHSGVVCEYKYPSFLESFFRIVDDYVSAVDTGVRPFEEELDVDALIAMLPHLKQELRRAEDYLAHLGNENQIGRAIIRADNSKKVENKFPENPDVEELCKAIYLNKGNDKSINQLAREITNGDDKRASSIARQARKPEFKWLCEGGSP